MNKERRRKVCGKRTVGKRKLDRGREEGRKGRKEAEIMTRPRKGKSSKVWEGEERKSLKKENILRRRKSGEKREVEAEKKGEIMFENKKLNGGLPLWCR